MLPRPSQPAYRVNKAAQCNLGRHVDAHHRNRGLLRCVRADCESLCRLFGLSSCESPLEILLTQRYSIEFQLKPKATAMFLLSCLGVYDIFVAPPTSIVAIVRNSSGINNTEIDEFWDYDTVEEDDLSISIRCYRGPALTAIALFCAAYSLRIWRRNGVACDQLLFLPGTPHEFRCTGGEHESSAIGRESPAATGGYDSSKNSIITVGAGQVSADAISHIKSCFSDGDAAAGSSKPSSPSRARSYDNFESVNTLETSHDEEPPNAEQKPLILESNGSNSPLNSSSSAQSRFGMEDSSPMEFLREHALRGIEMLVVTRPLRPPPFPNDGDAVGGGSSSSAPTLANNEVYDAAYAPSAPAVLGAALDLSLPVLFNFHMFNVLMRNHYRKEAQSEDDAAGRSVEDFAGGGKTGVKDDSWITPPQIPPGVLPLFFIAPLIIRSIFPLRQRQRFYKTILQGTALSLFKPVRFRDAFVADCVTSLVRPLGDLTFMLAYFFTATFGMFTSANEVKYTLKDANYKVSKSWILHGAVLPALSLLPLFVRFLQTLRQAYDTGKRWPYLGNSFKYLTAGLVVLYGVTHAAEERSPRWAWAFFLATVYQVVWDICMDWELFVFVPREPFQKWKRTSSPPAQLRRFLRDVMEQVRLRPQRLFDVSFYRKAILACGLRFCWMAGFIPSYRVSILDGSTQVTFVDKAWGWSLVLMAIAEIFRLSIWSIIKVELETIKLVDEGEKNSASVSTAYEDRESKRSTPLNSAKETSSLPFWRRCRPNMSSKPTLEDGKKLMRLDCKIFACDSNPVIYSNLEQSEFAPSLELPATISPEKQSQCWPFNSDLFRRMFILELLIIWPFAFFILSYYVVMAE